MSIMKQGLEFMLLVEKLETESVKGVEDQRIFWLSNPPKARSSFTARSEYTGRAGGKNREDSASGMDLQSPASLTSSAGRAGSGVRKRLSKLDPTAPVHHLLLHLATDLRVIAPCVISDPCILPVSLWPVPT